MKLYIAGKVSKESQFGTHHWRDNFVNTLSELSGMKLTHLDPLAYETTPYDPQTVFDKDCWLINQADCVIVYLSDDISVGGDRLHTLFSPEQIAMFDDVVLSYHVGMAKPDPRVYRLAAERLGVDPSECLFVDDKEVYCAAARDVGMSAIKYRDFEHFEQDNVTILS